MRRHVFEAARFWERAAQFTRAAQEVGAPPAAGSYPAAVGERWRGWRSRVSLDDRDLFDDADEGLDAQVFRYLFDGAIAQQTESGTHVVIVEES